jgi:hypothetical protein
VYCAVTLEQLAMNNNDEGMANLPENDEISDGYANHLRGDEHGKQRSYPLRGSLGPEVG